MFCETTTQMSWHHHNQEVSRTASFKKKKRKETQCDWLIQKGLKWDESLKGINIIWGHIKRLQTSWLSVSSSSCYFILGWLMSVKIFSFLFVYSFSDFIPYHHVTLMELRRCVFLFNFLMSPIVALEERWLLHYFTVCNHIRFHGLKKGSKREKNREEKDSHAWIDG